VATPAVVVHLRLDEQHNDVLPSDAVGALADLDVPAGLGQPTVADSFCGRGRAFVEESGFAGLDVVPGASLLTRDVTIQALMSWDLVTQESLGSTGTIVARGKGNAAAEYVSYALELRVVDLARQIGELRFVWQDTAGVVKTQLGPHFVLPASGFMMLTAVRRWVSSTSVELRYYIGDLLAGEFLSADGDIGGGTTGTFCLGFRYVAGVNDKHLVGVLDELRILNYEMSGEQVEATYARLARHQPRGYRALRDLMQPGAPVADDPNSRIQKLLRIAGHALGYVAAQAENVRRNLLPHRAYGPALEEWERALQESPRGGDSIAQRRRRLVAHLRQNAGVSPPGVAATIADLLALTKDQVKSSLIAFDSTVYEDFSSGLQAERWWVEPAAQWSIASGGLRVQNASSIPFATDWYTALQPIESNGRAAQLISRITPTTVASTSEVGIAFYNFVTKSAILLGLRNTTGTYQVVLEKFFEGASQGITAPTTFGGVLPTDVWLHLQQLDPGDGGGGFLPSALNATYRVGWSTTSGLAGFTYTSGINHRTAHQWAGLYARTLGGAANIDARFDDAWLRAPFGSRTSCWYALRDLGLPGVPDLVGAHNAISRLKHAFTHATAITNKSLLCDDDSRLCDRGPAGGI
jgi:hypothetical protein